MTEIKENSHISLNIYNNQKDNNNNKDQEAENSNPNLLQNLNTGISKEFPDNLRTEEYRRTKFPIITNNLGISNSVNKNNINKVRPEFIIQKNINKNNISNFVKNKNEKIYCRGKKCSKKACIITIIIISIIILLNIISMIVCLSKFVKNY